MEVARLGMAEEQQPELLVVGRLVAPQGLRGELRVLPLSDFSERFTRPGRRWLRRNDGDARAVKLHAGRSLPGKELFVVRLEGIDSREAAEALVGEELLVLASDRPRLAQGEFHLLDLIGLQVRLLESGTPVGTVRDLLHAGNDLLEVDTGKGRLLIPFVTSIVPVVELKEQWIGITPPPGLLDL